MASKKVLSGDHIMEELFNEYSEDNLIPESDSGESSDSERPESPEIALISDVSDEATPKTSQNYCLSLQPFIANRGLITDIHNTDVMFFMNLFITDNFLEFVCEQTFLYASQVISAAPHPLTKRSQFQAWTPVTTRIEKIFGDDVCD
jgi:hypothetical protein